MKRSTDREPGAGSRAGPGPPSLTGTLNAGGARSAQVTATRPREATVEGRRRRGGGERRLRLLSVV